MSVIFANPQWAYVIAAYTVTLGGLFGLAWVSYHAMRGAEAQRRGPKA